MIAGQNTYQRADHLQIKVWGEDVHFRANLNDEKPILQFYRLPNQLTQTFPAQLEFINQNGKVIYTKYQEILFD